MVGKARMRVHGPSQRGEACSRQGGEPHLLLLLLLTILLHLRPVAGLGVRLGTVFFIECDLYWICHDLKVPHSSVGGPEEPRAVLGWRVDQ